MKHPYTGRLVRGALALLATTLAGHAQAQAPAWQSAVSATNGATNWSEVRETATDAVGNVYLTGIFNGTMTLGSTTLSSAGGYDVFVAKWSPATQAFAWAQRAGGVADDLGYGLAVSGSSVYVSGIFVSPTAAFGSTTLTNAGVAPAYDVFVAKLTDAGAFVWAQRAGGTGGEGRTSVAVSGTSVYLAGTFGGTTATFGSTTLTNTGVAPTGDNFVAKLTDAGTTASWVWAQQFGSPDYDYGYNLAVRGNSVYVAGTFISTAAFGPLSLTSAANGDIYVAKLTDAGATATWTWVQRAGGPSNDSATALAVSGNSVYVGGSFEVYMSLGATITFGSIGLGSNASGDEYVAKLTDAGSTASWTWAKQAGNPYTIQTGQVEALKVSGTSVFVLGNYPGTTYAFSSTPLPSAGNADIFVAKLLDNGSSVTAAWGQRAGGATDDLGRALALAGGTVYAAGVVAPVVSFGSQTIASTAGAHVAFLATLADAAALATTPAAAPLAGLAAYPNPARRTTTVQLPAGLAAGEATLTLLDAVGRVVRTRTTALAAGSPQADFDVAGLAPGVYALRVAVAERRGTARLVVE